MKPSKKAQTKVPGGITPLTEVASGDMTQGGKAVWVGLGSGKAMLEVSLREQATERHKPPRLSLAYKETCRTAEIEVGPALKLASLDTEEAVIDESAEPSKTKRAITQVEKTPFCRFFLYIADDTSNSAQAIAKFRALYDEYLSERFHESVMEILNQTAMKPDTLELEVTESLLMKSPELTTSLFQSLRREGVKVAIDDFGTGYSSLSYLQKFPIDTLKIDQSFISQIESQDGLYIVKAIILMGHTLEMRIVAEGVETEREADLLQSIGCDDAQGYYFNQPMIPDRLATLLGASS